MKSRFSYLSALALASLFTSIVCIGRSSAQTPPSPVWRYTLLPGSMLTDDCSGCGRPTISLPLRGTFDLRLLEETPLFALHAVTNVSFSAGGAGQDAYKVTGHGRFEIGGEVWFSVETGFCGSHFESYGRGDLLSDEAYVVYRNLDLDLSSRWKTWRTSVWTPCSS
jgi:hypothetical protein